MGGFQSLPDRLAIGLLLTGLPAALAQSIFASLSGTVTDSNGAVVPGAKVNVQNDATKMTQESSPTNQVIFRSRSCRSATTVCRWTATGFQKWKGTGIVLHASDEKNVSIRLRVGGETETVEVSASAGEIDITDSGAKAETITTEDLEKQPLIGRNATEILRLHPRRRPDHAWRHQPAGLRRRDHRSQRFLRWTAGAGGMAAVSINGQSGTGLSINQDGQNVEDPGAPGAATPVNPNPDMISEV